MSKRYIIERKIDYEKEVIELLFRMMNNKSYHELKMEMLKRVEDAERPHITMLLDQLSDIEEGIKPYVDVHNKKLQFYFKRFAREELCIAKLLIQGSTYTKSKRNRKEKKNVLRNYLIRMLEDDSLDLSLTKDELVAIPYEDGRKVSFLERVDGLECNDAEKWKIYYVLSHAEKYMDELLVLLQPFIEKLSSYESSLQKLMDECADYWEKHFECESILSIVTDFFGVTQNSYPDKTTYIRPQIMDCNHVIFIGNDETMGDYHILEVGITFDKDFKATKKQPTKEQICNGLKLLSDPSKFQILKQINKKRAYGQELADMMQLTTATISHHMNALMGFGFITIEKIDNKVFYTMNQKAIKEFLAMATQVIVEEDDNEV